MNWSVNCFIVASTVDNQVPAFAINDTELYVPVVTSSTQNITKLLQQLKSGFKEQLTSKYINQKQQYRLKTNS